MQKKNRNLIYAWCVFAICVIAFFIGTKHFYTSQKEQGYQYRIVVDENIKKMAASEYDIEEVAQENNKSPTEIAITTEKKAETIDDKLYEKLECGYVPKISPDGVRVVDAYSAKFNDENKDKVCLVVLLDSDTAPNYLANVIRRLDKQKVTFVVPQYSNNLAEIVHLIVDAGHEFFLQIPTQTSVPNKKQGEVSPFLANMKAEELISKLHVLLASSKYAIGVANTTSTLLTKSSNGMVGVAEELAKRGLVFLDLEKAHEVMQKISENNTDFMYISVSDIFQKNVGKNALCSRNAIAVFIDDVPAFLTEFSKQKERILAPISAMVKK